MSESSSSFSILTNIFSSPKQAFSDIQKNYPVLLPMLIILSLNAILVVLLFMNIDFEWYIDHMVESTAGDLSKAEQDASRQTLSMMSPSTMSIFGAAGAAIGIGIIFCLTAAYLVIVSNVNNDGFQFKQWLSFVCWTSMPTLITVLASLVSIFMSSNGQIAPENLNPLSLNALFFGLDALKGAGSILASIDLSVFWSIILMTIGYSQWTGKKQTISFLIVVAPFAIFTGLRFVFV